jgi:signal transduction histidine kinase/ligand-binding sensor domain-containing protein
MPFKETLKLIVFLLTGLYCYGQPSSLLFSHLNVNNGLSQGVNNCIYKDSRGYVWISSFDGLNRFDGLACTIYRENLNDSLAIQGTLFLNILEDKKGNLWIGSNKGLNFYDRIRDRFLNYLLPGRKPDEQICSPFYIDDKNRVWLQAGSDIFRFDPENKQYQLLHHFSIPGNLFIKTIPAEQFNQLEQLYTIVNNYPEVYKGIIHQNSIQWTPLMGSLPVSDLHFNTLLPAPTGLWIGSNAGVLFYDQGRIQFRLDRFGKKEARDVTTLLLDKNRMLWFGTRRQGLFVADTQQKIITNQYISSALNAYSVSGNQLQYLYTDQQNHLWVSVWGKGVDYMSLDKFRFYHHLTNEDAVEYGIDNFIRSIIETDDHQFWCGTQSDGILILDKDKKPTGKIKTNLPPAIEHLYKDKIGQVWAATFSGLFVINPATKKNIKVAVADLNNLPASNQFNFITQLADGQMLASSNAGLFLVKQQGGNFSTQPVKGIPGKDVYLTSFCDNTGDIYISRAFKGFIIGTLQGDSFKIKKDFPYKATIKCFTETNDGNVWIGSTIGLMKFNKSTCNVDKIYTTNDGLSNQYIYGVLPDNEALWVSTNAGINRLQLSNNSIKSFDSGDGLQSNEFNTYSFCRATDGELLFGGVNGLNSFSPSAIHKYPYSPQLQLSALQINDAVPASGLNASELKTVSLRPDQNTLSFQFTVLDFAKPSANKLFYTLQGYDKNWIATNNKSLIRYANLPPGNYTLLAKAINAEKVEGVDIYKLPIIVLPPFWKTWWFTLLLILTMILLLYFFIKSYLVRQLQKQRAMIEKELAIEQERTRMACELHDGLGSMLSGIKYSFSAMKSQLDLNESQQVMFHSNIDKLNESIIELRNITHSMASDSLLKYGLDNSLRDYCNNMSQPGVLDISFKALQTEKVNLSEEQSFHIFRIVQELLQNIVKHAAAAHAIVQISYHAKKLYITVEDDGKGFEMDSGIRKNGMGLKNMESRIKILKGRMDFQTAPSKGTSVLIEIPCKENR